MWSARKPLRRRMHVHRMSKRLRWRRPGANLRVATTLDLASRARTSHAVCRFPFVSPARVRELSHLVTLPKSTAYEYLKEKLNIASASQKVIGTMIGNLNQNLWTPEHTVLSHYEPERGAPRASTAHPGRDRPSLRLAIECGHGRTVQKHGKEAKHSTAITLTRCTRGGHQWEHGRAITTERPDDRPYGSASASEEFRRRVGEFGKGALDEGVRRRHHGAGEHKGRAG